MAELSRAESLDDETRAELDALEAGTPDLERQFRAARRAAEAEEAEQKTEARTAVPDAEMRERVDLRRKASLTAFLKSAISGKRLDGAEAELREAAGVDGIPVELWDVPAPAEQRQGDAATGAPGTVGVNLDPIRPAVFAASIAPRLGIDMPRVESGTFASATIDTSLTAAAKGKGDAAEATAATFAVTTATAKRVSARLSVRIEDVASVGQANFEAALRENLSMALSDALDNQAINGDGTGDNLIGLFKRLTDATAPTDVANFDAFVTSFSEGIDGLWASTMKDVAIVAGPATYKLSAKTFRDRVIDTGNRGGVSLGDTSFADYAMAKFGGWWCNKRMPDPASNVQAAILHRKGRTGLRTAVCPHWNEIGIDDIYSGSAKGERYLTLHVLLGDVILVQSAAYAEAAFKLA